MTESATTRTLTTGKGRSVTTSLTDTEALALCKVHPTSHFAHDLAAKSTLSHDQLVWVHILAYEVIQPQPVDGIEVGSLDALVELFQTARQHLKYPKIRLRIGARLLLLKEKAGVIQVLAEDETAWNDKWQAYLPVFYGKVQDGKYIPSRVTQLDGIVPMLQRMGVSPAQTAAEFGRLTGRCCFCGRHLEDERSTAAGFGQTCAKHYGLNDQWKAAAGLLKTAAAGPQPVGADVVPVDMVGAA
jgi:hypothetical protein